MQYRKFGDSELETSVVGFGGWPMGRGHYGSFDETDVLRAIDASIDLGVTLFDTAAVYGWGEGEKLLGRALKGRRDKVVLVSKGGRQWHDPDNPQMRDSSKEALTKGLDESLQRLQTDYLDLYLIHWPDESRPMSEPMEAFAEFQRQGKIRYGGVSNFSVRQMTDCLDTFPIITNQVGYHLFDFRPEEEVFPFCTDNGMGAMAYGSLAHGLLTGMMTPETQFEEDDWRRSLMAFGQPLFKGETFLRNLGKVEALKNIASEKGMTVAQLALAWVISNPAVSVALVGTRRAAEMEENVKAAEWMMGEEEREEVRAVVIGE
ncbi:MAG: aldo/keto reductase [Chloroflexi bacterium]|nr:aldo/keto reductase [Chloroflexota bacterium]